MGRSVNNDAIHGFWLSIARIERVIIPMPRSKEKMARSQITKQREQKMPSMVFGSPSADAAAIE